MKFFKEKNLCSFTYLNITQFLGALNDNVFKLLIVFFLIDLQGDLHSTSILAKSAAIYVIPFLLFSTTAGKLADRLSKRNIIVFSKIMEVAVMALGTIAFALKSPFASYTILFLMALQSAIFSPSKYGIVPEIVSSDRITKANGILTSFTILAMISGTFIASFITDISGRHFVISSCLCTALAILGTIASFYIETTPAMGKKKKFNPFFLYEVYKTLSRAKQENRLFTALIGCSYFLFIASFIQLNTIPYGIQSLGLTDTQGGYLFMLTSLGIASGSILAGRLSGKHVELGLVPIGGLGIAFTCFLLYFFCNHFFLIIPLFVLLGIFGGLFEVPLESFIQANSPKNYLGQMVAATNFLGFLCVLGSSAFLYFNSHILGLQASEGFIVASLVSFLFTIAFMMATLDYFLRFIAFAISRIFFQLTITNKESSSEGKTPALILCNRPSSWIDALLLTAIQRPPLCFLIESTNHDKKLLSFLCRILRVILVPSGNTVKQRITIYEKARTSLKKGYTVCIFTKFDNTKENCTNKYLQELQNSFADTSHPIIPISINERLSPTPSKKTVYLFKEFPCHVTIDIGTYQKRS